MTITCKTSKNFSVRFPATSTAGIYFYKHWHLMTRIDSDFFRKQICFKKAPTPLL